MEINEKMRYKELGKTDNEDYPHFFARIHHTRIIEKFSEMLKIHGLDFTPENENEIIEASANITRRYALQVAEQVRQDCADNAKMVYHCGHTKTNKQTSHHQNGADNIQVDKSTILSTEIKLP